MSRAMRKRARRTDYLVVRKIEGDKEDLIEMLVHLIIRLGRVKRDIQGVDGSGSKVFFPSGGVDLLRSFVRS